MSPLFQGLAGLLLAALAADSPPGRRPFTVPEPADIRPVNIRRTVAPGYPATALALGLGKGEVVLAVQVNADASLEDSLVLTSTHPVFTAEVEKVLPSWIFFPALHGMEPIASKIFLHFDFAYHGVVMVEADKLDLLEDHGPGLEPPPFRPRKPSELDTPLELLQSAPAYYPPFLEADRVEGTALVAFYIDQEGRPRLPHVVAATNVAFAHSAAGAVKQWRFTPPTIQGHPVIVEVRQPFRFIPPDRPGRRDPDAG